MIPNLLIQGCQCFRLLWIVSKLDEFGRQQIHQFYRCLSGWNPRLLHGLAIAQERSSTCSLWIFIAVCRHMSCSSLCTSRYVYHTCDIPQWIMCWHIVNTWATYCTTADKECEGTDSDNIIIKSDFLPISPLFLVSLY
jgi:hypothetical protein